MGTVTTATRETAPDLSGAQQGTPRAQPSLERPLTPATVGWLQRHAGNRRVARVLGERASSRSTARACGSGCRCERCSGAAGDAITDARRALAGAVAARRVLARDCGGDCGCATCSAEPQLGAGATQLAGKTTKSTRKGKGCDPPRTIGGVVFVPSRSDEVDVATKAVEGSKKALAAQNIVLDLDIVQFLELGNLAFKDKDGDRSVDSYGTICLMMQELAIRRSKPGVVVLMVPISGEVCQAHGNACYISDFASRCPTLPTVLGRIPDRLIVLGRFTPTPTTLAHELGHHAGRPQRNDPRSFGHEERDPGNYMGFDTDRDHYRDELLERMCSVSFDF